MKINGIRGDGRPYRGNYQITPTSSDITVDKNQILTESLVIKGEPNLKAANIKNGVPMFGVEGTYKTNVINGETVSLTAAEDIAADSFVSVDFSPDDLKIGRELYYNYLSHVIRPLGTSGYFVTVNKSYDKGLTVFHAGVDKVIEKVANFDNVTTYRIIDMFAVDERTLAIFTYRYASSDQSLIVHILVFADDYKSFLPLKTCEWSAHTTNGTSSVSPTFKVYGIIPFECGNKALVSASANISHHLFMLDFSEDGVEIVNDSIIGFPAYLDSGKDPRETYERSYQTDVQKDSKGIYHICQYVNKDDGGISLTEGVYYYKIELIQDVAYILYPQTLITTWPIGGSSYKNFAYAFTEHEGVLHHRIVLKNNNNNGVSAYIHPMIYYDMTSNIDEVTIDISPTARKVKWDRVIVNPEVEPFQMFDNNSPGNVSFHGMHFISGIDTLVSSLGSYPTTTSDSRSSYTISFCMIVLCETEGYMLSRNVYQPNFFYNRPPYSSTYEFRILPMPEGKIFLYGYRDYNSYFHCFVLDTSEIKPKVFNTEPNRLSGIKGLSLNSASVGESVEVCIGG